MEYVTLKLELAYHELEKMVWGKAKDNLSKLEHEEEKECAMQAIQARFEGDSTFYDINDYIGSNGFLEDVMTKLVIKIEVGNEYYEMALRLYERIG